VCDIVLGSVVVDRILVLLSVQRALSVYVCCLLLVLVIYICIHIL